jgi:hypothetical protein
MTIIRWLPVSVVFLMLLVGERVADAHGGPLKTVHGRVGPYPVAINYYGEPIGGLDLVFTIVPDASLGLPPGAITYAAVAVPGTTTNAVPVAARLEADPDNPAGVAGTVNLPVSGDWLLHIEMDGPLGHFDYDFPILAGAPPAVPEWAGWLVGLLPVAVALGFIGSQARRAAPPSSAGAGPAGRQHGARAADDQLRAPRGHKDSAIC